VQPVPIDRPTRCAWANVVAPVLGSDSHADEKIFVIRYHQRGKSMVKKESGAARLLCLFTMFLLVELPSSILCRCQSSAAASRRFPPSSTTCLSLRRLETRRPPTTACKPRSSR
jgi:hypothetical protein